MTPNPMCVPPETQVSDAVVIMIERGFRHLPIVVAGRRSWACSRCATRCRAKSATRSAMAEFNEQVNDALG